MTQVKKKVLSIFTLTMITIGSVDSIRNLPSTALFGTSLIFFFLLGAIFFLIPTALVSAELSSSWTEQGGVYVWVREAFGKRFGFLAIWFQWVENVVWYPTILAFIAGAIAYLINPHLVHNKVYFVFIILSLFWLMTFVNWFGMRSSAWVSNIGAITGLLLPMGMIIALGLVWILGHRHLQINFNLPSLLPHLHQANLWVALTGIIFSFCGMEIATVHAAEVKDPQHAFPKALFYSVIIILSTLILGSLAIAIVVPKSQISLVAGIMEAFAEFLKAYHLTWVLPIMAVCLAVGGIAGVNNWIIAPLKGLLIAAEDDNLPKTFRRENRHNAPSTLLLWQAVLVTLLASLFLFLPSINESYWLLNALASQLYMLMYFLMFAAGIYLRFKFPERYRPYRIPGGRLGMIIVAGMGMLACVLTLVIGFFPPAILHVPSLLDYDLLIGSGLVILIIAPIVISFFHGKSRV